jgi:hypothetical protein
MQNRPNDRRVRWPIECALTGEHLVQNGAQSEDVISRPLPTAGQSLRGHVRDGPTHDSKRLRSCRIATIVRVDSESARETEIDNLAAIIDEHDVLRFQIAMADSAAVNSSQGVGELYP